jgi:zona occludens toxin (predicted ATPase)
VLAERYGHTPRDRRRVRRWAWVAASAFAVVLGAWLLWGGVLESLDTVDAQNTAHTVVSDHEVSVSWTVTVDPGRSASCALQALNESFSIVGWKIVEIPPSTERARSITESVRTTEQSVTGLIYRCWLT